MPWGLLRTVWIVSKGVSTAMGSDMEHKNISDISKHVLNVSVDYKTSKAPMCDIIQNRR